MRPLCISLVLLFLFCIWLIEVKAQSQDSTRVPESSGSAVVQATVTLIRRAGIFPDDHNLLRRIANVESKDGNDAGTYRKGYHGGIWKVNQTGFQDTQDTTAHPGLDAKFRAILREFDIDWPSVQWEDLRKPLHSGLAARLYLSNTEDPIPNDVTGQALYWKTYYNRNGNSTQEKFIRDVKALEVGKSCICHLVISNIDLDFLLLIRDNLEIIDPFGFRRNLVCAYSRESKAS